MKIADSVLNTFLHETHTCNILLTEPQNIIFLYNHYIQWKWNNSAIVTYLPETIYADCHFAEKHTIPNTIFKFLNIPFTDFCKNSLNQGFYISTFLNEKYLKKVEKWYKNPKKRQRKVKTATFFRRVINKLKRTFCKKTKVK